MRTFHLPAVSLLGLGLAAILACPVAAQQPFVTDDADITDKGTFTLEVANELDRLQFSSLPETYQNVTSATLAYGVTKNLEISVGGEFLGLFTTEDPRLVRGVGDTTLGAKYNLLKEKKGTRR